MNDEIPQHYKELRVTRVKDKSYNAVIDTPGIKTILIDDTVITIAKPDNYKSSSANLKDEQLGVMPRSEALTIAHELKLDLILINGKADPPLCKLTDYSTYRYQALKKKKDTIKNRTSASIKEIKLTVRIDIHDFNVRVAAARKFLTRGDRVKVGVWFKGREQSRDLLGHELLARFGVALNDVGNVEGKPKREGKVLSTFITVKPDVMKRLTEKRKAEDRKRKAQEKKREKERELITARAAKDGIVILTQPEEENESNFDGDGGDDDDDDAASGLLDDDDDDDDEEEEQEDEEDKRKRILNDILLDVE